MDILNKQTGEGKRSPLLTFKRPRKKMDNICRIPNNDEPPQGDEFDDDYEPTWFDIKQQKKEQAMIESFKKILDEKSTKPKKKYRTIRVHPETLRRLREKNEK